MSKPETVELSPEEREALMQRLTCTSRNGIRVALGYFNYTDANTISRRTGLITNSRRTSHIDTPRAIVLYRI